MKTTLLIMAAGIGSRFGTGIKQLEPVDDAGHIIMDYSIHDAIEAGFNHVVFIIRKDIEKEFKEVIGDRIASMCNLSQGVKAEGINIGEMRMLVQLVRDGDLKIERAAEKAKMTVEQFKKVMENTPLQAV